ncbi:MAG: hypothetical protein QOG10_1124 [Kribbellaceae bacterium]|jgi:hypothetical protein|nr:hypothetical protein [Kribbellaceae bacterium]
MRTSTYRMRPGRFLGILAAGLISLGVAALLWAFGLPAAVIAVFVVLGGLIALAGLWILARPPVLLKLRADTVEVRGVATAWTSITEAGLVDTTQGEAIALRTKRADDTTLIPLRWLGPDRAAKLTADLKERLNAANGYTIWDGTAAGPGDRAE